jgi:hypothetical protein
MSFMLEGTTKSRAAPLICMLLVFVTLAVYWPVLHCDFTTYDDDLYVTNNRQVQSGLTWAGLRWALTTKQCSNWHPVTWISHMADCELYGLDPAGHHATNLLFHIVNAVLIFLVLRRMTGAQWRSAFVAALFALHPLHVESVAWVAERKDVLSTFFWALTLWAYVRYVQNQPGNGSRESTAGRAAHARDSRLWSSDYARVVLFFVLGLMTKPMVVTLPFLLLLLDFWPLRRMPATMRVFGRELRTRATGDERASQTTLSRLIMEKLPLLALSLASGAVTLRAQHNAMRTLHCPFLFRMANADISYIRYIKKMVWPDQLVVLYPYPHALVFWQVVIAALALGCLTVLAIRHAKTHPYLLTGWLWYLGALVPVIGVVQVGVQSMANRYTYVPLLGLFIIIAWGAYDLAAQWRLRPVALGSMAVLALAACIPVTRAQVGYWKNSVVLFQRALRYAPNDLVLKCNLADGYYDQGQFDEAIRECRELIQLQPDYIHVYIRLGLALTQKGLWDEAISQYQRAIQLSPNDSFAHNNLGIALRQKGRYDEAIAQFQDVLRLDPGNAFARQNLNITLGMKGQ